MRISPSACNKISPKFGMAQQVFHKVPLTAHLRDQHPSRSEESIRQEVDTLVARAKTRMGGDMAIQEWSGKS